MDISRRRLLFTGALGVAAALDPLGVVRPGSGPLTGSVALAGDIELSPAITTFDKTLVRGPGISDGKGYRRIVLADGEPHIVRRELTDVVMVPLLPLKAFVQLSDLHCIDDQSPARLEFMDEFDNAGSPHFHSYGTFRAYRAHE